MWTISAREVMNLRPDPGGVRFTEFIDFIIRSAGFVGGLPYSCIETNLRTNKQDGGVDTRVAEPLEDDPTGRLRAKTIWQFRATEAADANVKALCNDIQQGKAGFAQRCITEGYAYRLCICDSFPSSQKQQFEEDLTNAARIVNPNIAEAMVLGADDLASWANQFAALILRVRPELAQASLHLEAWKPNVTHLTPTYVTVNEWGHIRRSIAEHADLSREVPDVLLLIQGDAGVGKTRLVYEALAAVEGLRGLVVYADSEEKAKDIARQVANQNALYAVLVADECSAQSRVDLRNLLGGHSKRARVFAIDHPSERLPTVEPESRLQSMPIQSVEEILERNFRVVPADRRRAYANLAEGFVGLAADMCHHDRMIADAGHVGPVLSGVRDYFSKRLRDEEQSVTMAVSLVTKVGFKGDVSSEMDDLCALVGLGRSALLSSANRLHDVGCFIRRAGKYVYVTPRIIAQIVFERAWQEWGDSDPDGFLGRLPASLLQSFIDRVARSANQEVRSLVGDFFRRWFGNLQPAALASIREVDRVASLVETEPNHYLPMLRRIVEEASEEQLMAVRGDWTEGKWGPRRQLVWLVERMAAFPEHFDDAERILLRFALAESEPEIGNNATDSWRQLYQVYLSGTAVPFMERIDRLRERVFTDDVHTTELAISALPRAFAHDYFRTLGPAVVGGRIPPNEWAPRNRGEQQEALDAAAKLLQDAAGSASDELRRLAYTIATDNLRLLISIGCLERVTSILPKEQLSDEILVRTITATEEYLHFDCEREPEVTRPPEGYVDGVRSWLAELRSTDLHGRLLTTVGVDSWHHSMVEEEDQWKASLRELAAELCSVPDALQREIGWLCSRAAKSSAWLGDELGRQDPNGLLLDFIVDYTNRLESPALARGYVLGFVQCGSLADVERLNNVIDRLVGESPSLAYELVMAGGDATRSLSRVLAMVDQDVLSPSYLRGFLFGVGSRRLDEHEFREVISRLARAGENGDSASLETAIEFIAYRMEDNKKQPVGGMGDEVDTLPLIWHILELSSRDAGGSESYWWTRILETLVVADATRVARIAARALVGESVYLGDEPMAVLKSMLPNHAQTVMEQVGLVAMDDTSGWLFYVRQFTELISSLPVSVVGEWLQRTAVEGARRIARHLPCPSAGPNGEALVPSITEHVLSVFEDDERVFEEFCAGVHSFQTYSGDIAAQHEQEAATARRFLNHPLRRIRDWAQAEVENATRMAAWWREKDEEMQIE